MGKSKKRILNKKTENSSVILKRNEIIRKIIEDMRTKKINEETANYISLFGIKAEELSEAGATYEELSSVKNLLF